MREKGQTKPTSRRSPARLPSPGSGPGERMRGSCLLAEAGAGVSVWHPAQPPLVPAWLFSHPSPDTSLGLSVHILVMGLISAPGPPAWEGRQDGLSWAPGSPTIQATLMFAGGRNGPALCSSHPDNVIPPPRLCSVLPTAGSPLQQLGLPLGPQEASSLTTPSLWPRPFALAGTHPW